MEQQQQTSRNHTRTIYRILVLILVGSLAGSRGVKGGGMLERTRRGGRAHPLSISAASDVDRDTRVLLNILAPLGSK